MSSKPRKASELENDSIDLPPSLDQIGASHSFSTLGDDQSYITSSNKRNSKKVKDDPSAKLEKINKELAEIRKQKEETSFKKSGRVLGKRTDYSKVPKKSFHHPKLEFVYGEIMNSPYLTPPLETYPKQVFEMDQKLKDLKRKGYKFDEIPNDEKPYDLTSMRNSFVKEIANYNPGFNVKAKNIKVKPKSEHGRAQSLFVMSDNASLKSNLTTEPKSLQRHMAEFPGGPEKFKKLLPPELQSKRMHASAQSLDADRPTSAAAEALQRFQRDYPLQFFVADAGSETGSVRSSRARTSSNATGSNNSVRSSASKSPPPKASKPVKSKESSSSDGIAARKDAPLAAKPIREAQAAARKVGKDDDSVTEFGEKVPLDNDNANNADEDYAEDFDQVEDAKKLDTSSNLEVGDGTEEVEEQYRDDDFEDDNKVSPQPQPEQQQSHPAEVNSSDSTSPNTKNSKPQPKSAEVNRPKAPMLQSPAKPVPESSTPEPIVDDQEGAMEDEEVLEESVEHIAYRDGVTADQQQANIAKNNYINNQQRNSNTGDEVSDDEIPEALV